MIALHKRTLRRPFDPRTFDIDRALDGKPQPEQLRFRKWVIRLNDRIETWLDNTAWADVVLRIEKPLMGLVLGGAALYLAHAVIEAWLYGQLGSGGVR